MKWCLLRREKRKKRVCRQLIWRQYSYCYYLLYDIAFLLTFRALRGKSCIFFFFTSHCRLRKSAYCVAFLIAYCLGFINTPSFSFPFFYAKENNTRKEVKIGGRLVFNTGPTTKHQVCVRKRDTAQRHKDATHISAAAQGRRRC